jgi:hypothetical protein
MSLGPGDPAPSAAALEELEREEPDMLRVRVAASERALRKVRSVLEGVGVADAPAVATRLVDSQRASRQVPVLDRVRVLVPALLNDPRAYVSVSMLLREIESHERAFTISWLSRRFRVATFGSGNLEAWGCRATNLGELKYDQMGDAYRLGKVGINVMRWQDDAGLNLKPYEITGAGVACLCQRRTGMEKSFRVGAEVEAFEGPHEAGEQLRALLADEPRREQLASAGHARTLASHGWSNRAQSMAALLRAA